MTGLDLFGCICGILIAFVLGWLTRASSSNCIRYPVKPRDR